MQTQVLFSTEIFGIRTILKNKTIQLRLPNILKIKKKKKKMFPVLLKYVVNAYPDWEVKDISNMKDF